MSSPLEVTGEDVARLDDASLRELIARLCEAEFRKARRSATGVIWGGDQNAPDGGFDVVIETEDSYVFHDFLRGTKSVFQVKKSKMPPAEIMKEMRPHGTLRASIRELIHRTGSYAIVSSGDSTSASSLEARRNAMRDAVQDEPGHENLLLDFLDRGRVATWVCEHPSYILWVRDRVGRHIQGWQPYANWSHAPGGLEEEYLLDEEVRLYDDTRGLGRNEGLSIEAALREVRSRLSCPGASLRLAGLSGVGKTRFAMALFDDRIGDNALDPTLAFYTDVSHGPDPEPQRFVQGLVADGTRAILIVDNCPPELHRRLTPVCAASESAVSLMTIEYDVREDLPAETRVFRLEPAGESLITRLLEKRFQHLSQTDAQRIAHLSGGNPRLAIALAGTVQRGETLSGFRDDDLFKRLFWQRNDPSESLLSSAEACSLVYSFHGADTSENSELRVLSSLVGKAAMDLYRDVGELRSRDLVQKRGLWRAVLPHALANHLAGRALQRIPRDCIITTFLQSGSERLIRSFTRRLSFLHDSEEALVIAEEWLEEGGWLGDVSNLSDFGIQVFQNIAPLSPEMALLAIERAARADRGGSFATRENPHRDSFVRLLRSLAYDAARFRRSTRLICQFALDQESDQHRSSSRDVLTSLFQLYLSGTHASPEERVELIEELVATGSERHQELALIALNSALEAWHFSSHYDFSFGARPRDFGYQPRVQADVVHWYRTFIGCCVGLATSNQPIAEKARALLATSFRALWAAAGMVDELEDAAARLQGICSWTQGWTAVRETLKFDGERLGPDSLSRLRRLEDFLQPRTLIERARTYAFVQPGSSLSWLEEEDAQDEGSDWARMEGIILQIGSDIARDDAALSTILPELVSTNGQFLQAFGRGLAQGSSDPSALWHRLRGAFEEVVDPAKRNPSILVGFVAESKSLNAPFCESTLDQLLSDSLLGTMFPWFQVAAGIDQRGLIRLNQAAEDGALASIEQFRHLAFGRQHQTIEDDDLSELLDKIASRENGIPVAVEILAMRFYPPADKSRTAHSTGLIECGRRLLMLYNHSPAEHDTTQRPHNLSRIAKISLAGQEGEKVARHLCEQILSESGQVALRQGYPDLLKMVARLQPNAFLDIFVGGDLDSVARVGRRWWRLDDFDRDRNPLNEVSGESIISWCGQEPNVRYQRIAVAVPTFVRNTETKRLECSPLILRLIEQAPDIGALLESLSGTLIPMSWSGSRADLLEQRAVALQELFEHARAEVSSWARHRHSELQEEMWRERRFEESRRREQDESFE
jgi:hypothetical protein